MFCPNCGFELDGDLRYCTECGYALEDAKAVLNSASNEVAEEPMVTEEQKCFRISQSLQAAR